MYNLRDSYFTKVHIYFIHIVDEWNISALMIFGRFNIFVMVKGNKAETICGMMSTLQEH